MEIQIETLIDSAVKNMKGDIWYEDVHDYMLSGEI